VYYCFRRQESRIFEEIIIRRGVLFDEIIIRRVELFEEITR